ncbi:DMT family transporter [Pseudoruegeria sp. HB172150]|uniref:DMT family transporter n=1 Tax=Pseudoruegeria sp. HB172150 TaxID=2721164 RepID=UPI00155250C5|nr:DMT family transporter [Pseudoruegeria sp. HB172150]
MAAMSDNLRGSMLMAASMASFTINDACMKATSDELPMFQALFLRGVSTSLLMLVLAWMLGGLSLRFSSRDWMLILMRNVTEIGAAYFFLSALFNMPLANASAIMQALPLSVTLAGAVFMGEVVGWRRLSAIMFGFIGVMLIVRPGAEGFSVYSLYALVAVTLVTARDIISRKLSALVPSMTVALFNAVSVMVFFGLASIFIDWAPLSGKAAAQLGLASVLIIGGYLFSVSAMRVGEIAVVAPFRYTSLLWALLLGFVVFGDWPEPLTLLGAGIVVATGVYTFYRERRLRRPQFPPKTLRIR